MSVGVGAPSDICRQNTIGGSQIATIVDERDDLTIALSRVLQTGTIAPAPAPPAAQVPRRAHMDMDATESALASENALLFARLWLPPAHHGGRRVSVPQELAARLHRAFLAAFARGERSGNAGGLHVVHGGREHVFWGFETYDRVQAALVRSEQRKWTTMLPVHEFEEVSWQSLLHNGLDGFTELISLAKEEACGLTLLACHMLRQDSPQACFSWHQDSLNNPHTRLSMVFLLSPGTSTMRIAGYESFTYDEQGCGCAFPSEAHHRSGQAKAGTMKITFFFGDAVPAASLLVARKERGEW